ncbi:MAG: M14 family zinc carboxypeptidase [Armatimonadota bacterium]
MNSNQTVRGSACDLSYKSQVATPFVASFQPESTRLRAGEMLQGIYLCIEGEANVAVRVTDDIPYGNVCDVEIIRTPGQREVKFAASTHGGPECLWFCFRIESDEIPVPSEQLRLTLKHVSSMLGCAEGDVLVPVMREDGEEWKRMEPAECTRGPDGACTASWLLTLSQNALDLAFCYPYGQPEVEALISETNGYWTPTVIGVSHNDRPIVRLMNPVAKADEERPGLLFIARQHSAETPGSWVLAGLLRELAERDSDLAVWAVPLSNIDGVEQGDYGKDNFPYDLNRAWGQTPMRHETLVIQKDIAWFIEQYRPALAVDFHAPGGTEDTGAYAFLPNPDDFPDIHEKTGQWAEAFADGLGDYAAEEFARVATYPSRWETPNFTTYCAGALEIPAFTLETPYAKVGDRVLSRRDYRTIGTRMAETITHNYTML